MGKVYKCGQSLSEDGPVLYEIGGEEFYQNTLTLGQSIKLFPYVDGINLDTMTIESIVSFLGEKMGDVLGVVLIPSGTPQVEHTENLETPGKVKPGKWFLSHLNHADLIRVGSDFFVYNLNSSLLNTFKTGIQGVKGQVVNGNGRNALSPSCPGETQEIKNGSLDYASTS